MKILHGDNNNSPLNYEEYDHAGDIINSEYYSLMNRIKDKCIKKYQKPSSCKEHDFRFVNNKKFYIVVKKPNALQLLSNRDSDKSFW